MPRQKIVSVRDRAADAFMQPWFVPTLGMAIRAFADEVNKQGSNLNSHPEDYDLYHLGEFDDETAIFECCATPKQIAIGKDLILKSN